MENKIKLVGVVDWFHDKIRDADYGFVRHEIIGQHYFNDKSVASGADLSRFKMDTVVTFSSRESGRKKGTFEAYNVSLAEDETDLHFLISEFLNSILFKRSNDTNLIRTFLKKRLKSIFSSFNPETLKFELANFENQIAERIVSKQVQLEANVIIELTMFIHDFDVSLAEKIEKDILQKTDKKTIFDLWIDGRISYVDPIYIDEIFSSLDKSVQEKVIRKLDSEQRRKVLLHQIYLPNLSKESIGHLIELIDRVDQINNAELLDVLIKECNSFFVKDFWNSDNLIIKVIIKHTQESDILRSSVINVNAHFLQKEIEDDLFHNVHELTKLHAFIEENLNENISLLKKIITEKVNVEVAHELWLLEILDACQIDYIAQNLNKIEEKEKEKIFSRCDVGDKTNILFKAILNLDLSNAPIQYASIKEILSTAFTYSTEIKEKILSEIINNIPEHYKLNLWIDDFYEVLDFNLYKPYVITLTSNEQRIFLKKVLKYIHEERVSLGLDDLTSLNVMDYDTSMSVRQIDGTKLDFSTSIVLNTLKELNENQTLKESTIKSKILEIIINQIENPEDLLEITGYFDKCAGRCKVHRNEKNNDAGETIVELSYERNSDDLPRMHTYCDGRKSLKTDNETPNLHDITNKEFWWCANLPCHETSRQLHSAEDWRNYSLMDFLHILKIDYKEIDIELYLNVINKLNRFLSHMSCRTCNHILRPIGKSKYAFWGVSNFHCINEKCDDKKSIYISHCLNGRCGETIDSRDSVKCSPEGFSSEQCGWYICQNCHSCCSNSAIQIRTENLRINDRKYVCHTEGHKDQGIMFCNQCGSKMNNSEGDPEKRKEVIQFFRENINNSKVVASSGQRPKDGGWWFRFSQGQLSDEQYEQKLLNLLKLGFNIPKIEDKSLSIQLVSEPYPGSREDNFLFCSNTDCGKTINLADNLERARAITGFHSKIFPNVKIARI
jgi:hypothetical protein